jgi:poly(A) polymerase
MNHGMPERPGRGAFPWPETPADLLALAADISEGQIEPPDAPPPGPLLRQRARVLDVAPDVALRSLDRALTGPRASGAVRFLEATGALGILLPEVAALVDFHESCPVHHKDLWSHTLEVLERTPASADLRWVALLHDTGKLSTRTVDDARGVSFLKHEQVGAHLMQGVGARLAMGAERIARITFVISHHGRFNAYESSWSDRAVRRLIRDSGEHLEDLLAFGRVDYTTRKPERRRRIEGRLRDLETRLKRLTEDPVSTPELPSGLGTALMEGLGLNPGPDLGRVMAGLRDEIASGRLSGDAPAETFLEVAKIQRSQGD